MIRNLVFPFSDNFEQSLIIILIKGQKAKTHGVKNDPQAPNVKF